VEAWIVLWLSNDLVVVGDARWWRNVIMSGRREFGMAEG
jgi:hypothetical protein